MKLKHDDLLSNFGFNCNMRPCTKALAAAATRPLPPALDNLRRTIDDDMGRLTGAMSRLEADLETKEREKRRIKVERCRLTPGFCS